MKELVFFQLHLDLDLFISLTWLVSALDFCKFNVKSNLGYNLYSDKDRFGKTFMI